MNRADFLMELFNSDQAGSFFSIRLMRFLLSLLLTSILSAHPVEYHKDPFRQLEDVWPTPTETRIASGAPGPKYWQQRADYDIQVSLNEETDEITGHETIIYYNESPHTLEYLWIQLDRNRFNPNSLGHQSREAPRFEKMRFSTFARELGRAKIDGSFKISAITDQAGKALPHRIVDTMMRVDLPEALKPKEQFTFKISWHHRMNDRKITRSRSAVEEYKDKNKVFEVAQWFPRVAAYTDMRGWQNKAFAGRGEFALEFGDYRVAITVPDDHIVAATGEIQNPKDVLNPLWQERLTQAEDATAPMFIITPEEAKKNESSKPSGTKTWIYEAKNVRDFAWASSRKFIWDAVKHKIKSSGTPVWAMSYYPNEAEPLWSQYSTHAVIHTLDIYSRYTFDYPYPVAISVNGPVYGMEYPMICFNGPKPEKDGTYSEKEKNRLISVIIHEVGHNWFPMIVNSDERQWTWMDEGINSFLQSLAENEWREHYPSRAVPERIINYMTSSPQRPIMTNSESVIQFGSNAYAKPAIGLVILRETILGREIFDDAFQKYCQRWMFKRPEPADFFRTMEDASGVDLDWFWYGWFYSTGHVDIAITEIKRYLLDNGDLEKQKAREKKETDEERALDLTTELDKDAPKYVDEKGEALKDFYDRFNRYAVTDKDTKKRKELLEKLEPWEKKLLESKEVLQVVTFENKGGLVMPLLLELHFQKKKPELIKIPAEIWTKNHKKVRKLFITDEPITKIVLDPRKQTSDAAKANNIWPQEIDEEYFELTTREKESNPMRDEKKAKEEKAKEAEKAKENAEKAPEKKKE